MTMRYRIDPQFWPLLAASGMTAKDLAAQTPHGEQWVYRLKRDPSLTVSAAWVEAVVRAFPTVQRAAVRATMTLVRERYWVHPDFWGLLVVRRMSRVRLAPQVGVTQQQLNAVARHPNYTLDGKTVERICEVLHITDRARYFTPAIRRGAQYPDTYLLAS
jgi:DNA-binding Xre family transcriptional regulator